MSLQVLSNIAELELEDAALLRVLGHRLVQIGQLDLAVQTFEQVLELRPEEPQSYRDLALTLARRAEQTGIGAMPAPPEAIRADYARAVDLLVRVVLGRWDARFPEIEVIALEELNRLIPRAKAAGVSDVPLDPRLLEAPGRRRAHRDDLARRQHRHRPVGDRALGREGLLPAQPHDDRRTGQPRLHPGLWTGGVHGPQGGRTACTRSRPIISAAGPRGFWGR